MASELGRPKKAEKIGVISNLSIRVILRIHLTPYILILFQAQALESKEEEFELKLDPDRITDTWAKSKAEFPDKKHAREWMLSLANMVMEEVARATIPTEKNGIYSPPLPNVRLSKLTLCGNHAVFVDRFCPTLLCEEQEFFKDLDFYVE